ncbi:MAG: response regulator [Gammaproteobacteria bacterium]|nr:response regulator [Gammaproteobacteria bacterium]NBT45179.1 response regulator [Gammaproteobacteria bacterium]NBY21945.1 response regulator [Gammaproteobacteria bacterium]NDE34325.1 response regulator [Gammaproteobacteria bacterium]NDG87469.1 response regulator [Gammaproteobacteria bacterium]
MPISGKKILVVDDDDSLRRGLAWLFEYEGAITYQFENGAAAVDWLEGNPNSCDAIIMDLQMPVMDGMTAIKHIREVLEIVALPIIAITGQSLRDVGDEAIKTGFNHVLEKPLGTSEKLPF